jgi:hypothetical protein
MLPDIANNDFPGLFVEEEGNADRVAWLGADAISDVFL